MTRFPPPSSPDSNYRRDVIHERVRRSVGGDSPDTPSAEEISRRTLVLSIVMAVILVVLVVLDRV